MIAFFDFDGTISTKDSMIDFLKIAVGKSAFYIGLLYLSPMLLAFKLKLISGHYAKEKFLSYYLCGWDISKFQSLAENYSLNSIDKIILIKAMDRIKWHQEKNHKVVVVSASIENWLKKWCEKHNINLIATQLEVKNEKLTGKLITPNCNGKEKVRRIKMEYNLSEYSTIYAYGNSSGDKDMLSIADKKYYKPFK